MLAAILLAPVLTLSADLKELDQLLALYREYRLPFPPAKAPLRVLAPVPSDPRDLEVAVYETGRGVLWCGTTESDGWTSGVTFKGVTAETAKSVDFRTFGPFEQDTALALAVIERSRGHSEFALTILDRARQETPQRWNDSELVRWPKGASLAVRMRYLALQHWLNAIPNPRYDRGPVLQGLQHLLSRHPDMRTNDIRDLACDLKTTVEGAHKGNDLNEKLIDRLCELEVSQDTFYGFYPPHVKRFKPVLDLVRKGFAAIPALIRHREDRRFIRDYEGSYGFSTWRYKRVGEVCSSLLTAYQGGPFGRIWKYKPSTKNIDGWWTVTAPLGERKWLLEVLSGRRGTPTGAIVRMAQYRHPDLLRLAYEDILRSKRNADISLLSYSLEETERDKNKIRELALRGTDSPSLTVAKDALQTLSNLDPVAFEIQLLKALDRLPRRFVDAKSMSSLRDFAELTSRTASPEAWKRLRKAAEEGDPEIRLTLISGLNIGHFKPDTVPPALEFLLTFFDDSAVATTKDRWRFSTPTLSQSQRIQDEATSAAAHLLELPNWFQNRTSAQWDTYRVLVREAARIKLSKQGTTSSSG